jgi:hypothetical protein
MADSEGSVFVEGSDMEESEDSSLETTNEESEVQTEAEKQGKDNSQKQETESEVAPVQKSDVKVTEKGTKLDENPLSAVHQKLANAERRVKDMEAVLRDPETLMRYLDVSGYKKGETAKAETKAIEPLMKIDVNKLQTAEDVAEMLNGLQTSFMEKINKSEETITNLTKQLQSLGESRRVDQISSIMSSDVSKIRGEYPELDPKSGEGVYNSELEKDIAELYHSLDYDEHTGKYKGSISLYQIAKQVMSAASKARKQGSEQAQTEVRNKQTGKIVTSSNKTTAKESESSDPGLTIASRVSRALNYKK